MPKGIYKRTENHKNVCRKNGLKNSTKPRGGGYDAIHAWLRKHYGKADSCENPNCKGISKRYHWCLIKGKTYDHNIKNFIQMCASCHRLYDNTAEWVEKVAKKRRERKTQPDEVKRKISISLKGKNKNNKRAAKPIQQQSISGHFIKNWDCAASAANVLGINASGISMCCSGKLKKSGGYKWTFLNK